MQKLPHIYQLRANVGHLAVVLAGPVPRNYPTQAEEAWDGALDLTHKELPHPSPTAGERVGHPANMGQPVRVGATVLAVICVLLAVSGCRKATAATQGFVYVSNGKSDTVTVIDTATFAPLRTLNVGKNPTGVTPNPVNGEVYVVNSDSGSVSVIDARSNQLLATMAVQRNPYYLAVTPDGTRAFVTNAGSNSVTVLNLRNRQLLGNIAVAAQPGVARVSPDGKLVAVSARGANAVSLIDAQRLEVAATIPVCETPEDIAILPDSSKAFVACTASHQVAVIDLKNRRLLTLLRVGGTPVSLALKPDGGELFVFNFEADTISAINTESNEVSESFLAGNSPVSGVFSSDSSLLYVSNLRSNSIAVFDVATRKLLVSVPVGSRPDQMVLTPDEQLLFVADTGSGDVSVLRLDVRRDKKIQKPPQRLFTMIPTGMEPNGLTFKSHAGERLSHGECTRCRRDFSPVADGDALCPDCRGEMATAIRQARSRRPPLSFWLHSPTVILIALNVLVFVAMAVSARSASPGVDKLILWGANFGPLTLGGQWWRLLSSAFLHANILHLALNMWAFLNLGILAEMLLGRRSYVLLYLFCALGGSIASVWWHSAVVGVGLRARFSGWREHCCRPWLSIITSA